MKAVLFGIWLLLLMILIIICEALGISTSWRIVFCLPSAGFVLYGLLRGDWGGKRN